RVAMTAAGRPDRFAPLPGPPHPANAGVRLSGYENNSLLVMPLGAKPLPSFTLPAVPSTLVERASAWLRYVWTRRATAAAWLLYLDVQKRTWWSPMFPPQLNLGDDVRLDLQYGDVESPPTHVRL